MAIIEKLHILRFRNLDNQYLELNKNINLFIGSNGQGKTNLIESIYYLGHNRSFKTKNIKDVVPFEKDFLQIKAVVDNVGVSIKKSKHKSEIIFDDTKVSSNSKLTHILPTQVISPDRGFVIGGTPKLKRSYLDWGVFHTNKDILKTYKSYNKAQKNINTLLSSNNLNHMEEWLSQIAGLSVEISLARNNYIENLKTTLKKDLVGPVTSFVGVNKGFDFTLQPGWTKDVDYLNQREVYSYLINNKSLFFKNKHLSYGPHKATLDFSFDKKNENHLSRGEQKKLSTVFWMLQVLFLVKTGVKPIVLIDDISSELDQNKINETLNFLTQLDVQIFLTDIGNKTLPLDTKKTSTYHIKKGVINSK
jgi:DNA replication and repair protein RecF